jgi:hypothetical protein
MRRCVYTPRQLPMSTQEFELERHMRKASRIGRGAANCKASARTDPDAESWLARLAGIDYRALCRTKRPAGCQRDAT